MKECLEAQLKLHTKILSEAYEDDDLKLIENELVEIDDIRSRLAQF